MIFITLPIDKVNESNILFDDKQKNTIMNDSDFYMIHYENEFCSIHNFIVKLSVSNVSINRSYNKYICECDKDKNIQTMNDICNMEKNILKHFMHFLYLNRDPIKHHHKQVQDSNKYQPHQHIEQKTVTPTLNTTDTSGVIVMNEIRKHAYDLNYFNKYKPKYNLSENAQKFIFKTKHITTHIGDYETKHYETLDIYIKISGIWVTNTEYGLIYKIVIDN
jgi:hypothetical protein